MGLRTILGPSAEPVSLTEAKLALRVDEDDEDTLIQTLVTAARERVESLADVALVTQTLELSLSTFPWDDSQATVGEPEDQILLPRYPLQSVVSITYVDEDGVDQTLDAADYQVDTAAAPGRVVPAYDDEWPTCREQPNSVRIRYRAGYCSLATVDHSANRLTVASRTFTDDDIVRLHVSGGDLPAGLAAFVDYYVVNVSGSTFQLSLTESGSAVDITDAGSGSIFVGEPPAAALALIKLLTGTWYENREAVVTGTIATEVQMTARVLLEQIRQWRRW